MMIKIRGHTPISTWNTEKTTISVEEHTKDLKSNVKVRKVAKFKVLCVLFVFISRFSCVDNNIIHF